MKFTPSATFLISLLLLPAAGRAAALRANFTDVDAGAWYADYVNQAANEGIVSGYVDKRGAPTGEFGPQNHVTIAEALKIGINASGHAPANKMGGAYWVLPYMDYAFDHHFAIAQGAGFDFQHDATRAEVASIIADSFAVDQQIDVDARYDDVTAKTNFAAAIEALSRDGILTGDTDAEGKAAGHFRPGDAVNRAEAVKMVLEARAKYAK